MNAYNFSVTEKFVIFGVDDNIRVDRIIVFIVFLAKNYLYKCKLNKQNPNINSFIKVLAYRHKIEEYNAKLKQEYAQFIVDWLPYREMIS